MNFTKKPFLINFENVLEVHLEGKELKILYIDGGKRELICESEESAKESFYQIYDMVRK